MDSRPAFSFRGRESKVGRGRDREEGGGAEARERKEETEQERCRAELTASGGTRRPHLRVATAFLTEFRLIHAASVSSFTGILWIRQTPH